MIKGIFATIGFVFVVFQAARAWDRHVEKKWKKIYEEKTHPAEA